MPETTSFSRPVRLEDFFDNASTIDESKSKYDKHNSYNDTIFKNQQEFGHRKRIKP